MKTILINGNRIQDKSFHEYFKKKLNIIGYHGNNLDAMYDVLSTYNDELNLYVYDLDMENISEYGSRVMETLEDLKKSKENIKVKEVNIKRKY